MPSPLIAREAGRVWGSVYQAGAEIKETPAGFHSLSNNLNGTENEIGRGGVYGAAEAIFLEENPIFRKKNRFLADFTTGSRRLQVKSEEGWLRRGNGSPVRQTVK